MENVYDVLRRLIAGGAWTEQEQRDALKLVDEFERDAIFGSRAAEITMQEGARPHVKRPYV